MQLLDKKERLFDIYKKLYQMKIMTHSNYIHIS